MHPLPATLPEPEPEVRPTFLAIAAASMPDTSSPMNIDRPGLLPFGISPIDALPVTITVEARVACWFLISVLLSHLIEILSSDFYYHSRWRC